VRGTVAVVEPGHVGVVLSAPVEHDPLWWIHLQVGAGGDVVPGDVDPS
jgi:hypothetical protein